MKRTQAEGLWLAKRQQWSVKGHKEGVTRVPACTKITIALVFWFMKILDIC